MAIEAILFDLGKVLIDFSLDSTVRQLTSCSATPAEFERVFRAPDLARRYETGVITTREFYDHLCRFGGLHMEVDAFRAAWTSMFKPGTLVSEDLLASLGRRYPLILVSNTNEAHAEFIAEKYRVFEYFAHKVFSFEVGSLKPEARIFEHAIAVSGKKPEALFFTDDREENVQGARAFGIEAHRFRCEADLIRALNDAGVDVGISSSRR